MDFIKLFRQEGDITGKSWEEMEEMNNTLMNRKEDMPLVLHLVPFLNATLALAKLETMGSENLQAAKKNFDIKLEVLISWAKTEEGKEHRDKIDEIMQTMFRTKNHTGTNSYFSFKQLLGEESKESKESSDSRSEYAKKAQEYAKSNPVLNKNEYVTSVTPVTPVVSPAIYDYQEYSTVTGKPLVPCKPHQYRHPETNRCRNYRTFNANHKEGKFNATFEPLFSKPLGKNWLFYDTFINEFRLPSFRKSWIGTNIPSRHVIRTSLADGHEVWVVDGSLGDYNNYAIV